MKKEDFMTVPLLQVAQRKAIERALKLKSINQFTEMVKWDAKAGYISKQLKKFESIKHRGLNIPQDVFISYSVTTGSYYYEQLEALLKRRRFNVLNGFQKTEEDMGNILERVLMQLQKCTVFLSVLTKEHKIQSGGNDIKWSPSIWTVEEKGMALAMHKPIVIMIEDGVHEDFWKKTMPHKVHTFFNKRDFSKKSDEVVEAVIDRYNEYAKGLLNS